MTEEFLRKLADACRMDYNKVADRGERALETEILRRTNALSVRHKEAIENEVQWKARFEKLVQITEAGEITVQAAMDAAIPDNKMDLLRWLSPNSIDFLGSGMTSTEFFIHHQIKEMQSAFSSQMRDELQRRIRLIMRLGYEHERICQADSHGTGLISSFVEDLIRGKFDDMREQIGWMHEPLFSKSDREKFVVPDGHEAQQKRRDELWAPILRVMYEACEHLTAPVIERQYDTVEAMLGGEGGLTLWPASAGAVYTTPQALAEWEVYSGKFGPRPSWSLATIEELFQLGVRWRGPKDPEPGYWHMANGEPFPDDPEKYWGTQIVRHYSDRPLDNWLCRHAGQEEKDHPAKES